MSDGAQEAEAAVVAHALARGLLTQASLAQARQSAAARGGSLLDGLRAVLPPAALPELGQVHRAALARRGSSPPAPIATTLDVAPPVARTLDAAPPGAATRAASPEADRARGVAIAALRDARRLDPTFAPHVELDLTQVALLGQGGMGAVHRVRDQRLGREAALKVMLAEGAHDLARARFKREAEVTARLDHPAIPPVYEAGTDARGLPYLLMRVIEGEPLSRWIAAAHEGARPDVRALRPLLEALVRVAEAVAHAHERRMVHRDLKPANVMVGRHGEVLVMDWGLVRLLDAPDDSVAGPRPPDGGPGLTLAGALLGTPGYMAPEQCAGEPVDARADVFSLGAMLVEVLTGAPPVVGPTVLNIVNSTIQGQIATPRSRWRGCPPALDRIAARALALERGARTATASAFLAELRAWLADEEVPGDVSRPLEAASRLARRRPALVVGLTGALAIAAVATSLGLVARARGRTAVALEGVAEAERLAAAGKADDAAAVVSRALDADEGRAVRAAAASTLFRAGRFADARAVLAPSIAREPRPWAELLLAHRLLDAERPDAADRADEGSSALEELARRGAPGDADPALSFARAALAMDDGRPDEALAACDAALEADPTFCPALRLRAGVRWRARRDAARARDDLDALLRLEVDPLQRARGLALRATLRQLDGEWTGALADADEALALEPRAAQALVTRGQALAMLGRRDEARAALEAAARSPRQASRARTTLAEVALYDARLDEALALAEAVQRDDPAWPDAYGVTARVLLARGDVPGARAAVDRAVALDPGEPTWLGLRATARQAQGDREGALADADAAVAGAPGSLTMRLLRARVRAGCGDPDGALADCEEALRPTGAGRTEALTVRAQVLAARGDVRAALADLDQVLALDPRDAVARETRSRLRTDPRGWDPTGAIADLTDLLLVSPARRDLRLARVGLFTSTGVRQEALAELRALLAADPGDPDALAMRARLTLVDDPRAALADYEAALRRAPDAPPLLAGRLRCRVYLDADLPASLREADALVARFPASSEARLLRGELRLGGGDASGAEGDATAVLAVHPTDLDALAVRGMSRVGLGRFADARADLDAVVAARPGDHSVLWLRAEARLGLGDRAGALADLDAALAVLPASSPAAEPLRRKRAEVAALR